jgi:uncharacterized delta-60 repeat protein
MSRLKFLLVAVASIVVGAATACGGGSGGSPNSASLVKSQTPSPNAWAVGGTVVVDGAGRILAARRESISEGGKLFAVSRFMPDGSLDSSFGDGGTAVADFGSVYGAGANEVALQHDGKIVVFGWSASRMPDPVEGIGLGDLAIARYLPDGKPDPGFGNGGKVVTPLGRDFAAGAIRPDGRIVVLATEPSANDVSAGDLVRYLPDGRLDRTFGKGGKVEVDAFSPKELGWPHFGADGALLLAEPPGPFDNWYSGTKPKGILTRYQPDGRLDPSFGDSGKAVINGSSPYSPLAVQDDGKIVAGGGGGKGGDAFALARYTSDGRLDTSFGSGGTVLPDFGPPDADSPSAAAVLVDGKILVAGGHSPAINGDPTHDFLVLVRLTSDGQLDRAFGAGGKVVSKSQGGPAYGLALQSDGKIVLVARPTASLSYRTATLSLVLTRYTAEGKLDKSFGDGGTVAINAPSS